MAITMRLRTTTPAAVDKLLQKSPIAQARAINRAIVSANAALIGAVAGDTRIKVSTLRTRIKVGRPATPEFRRAKIFASNKGIPLIEFRARGPEPSRGKGTGVTATIQGGAVKYPRAFIATMPGGHRGVFRRVEGVAGRRGAPPHRSQLPIKELYGPSIWRVALYHRRVGLERGREQLVKNLKSEFRFVLAVERAAA